MEILAVIVGFVLLLWLYSWVEDKVQRAKLYDELRPRLADLEARKILFRQQQSEWHEKVSADREAINRLATEKSLGFPWLAQAYADYFDLQDRKTAEHLAHKHPPARRAAEQVREIAAKRRVAEKLWRVLKYQLQYYEALFPWLVDFKGEDLDDRVRQLLDKTKEVEPEIDDEDDAARHWLTQAEYESLPSVEKYQRALDRYWKKRKSKWEVGRDYERYVGYRYEIDAWQVKYQGIVEGLADLGRDLIATRGNSAEIIQCKYWSKDKLIHEKHIFHLYGTMVAYKIDHPRTNPSAVLVTSTALSDRAKKFADELRVRYLQAYPLQPYPSIKCNVSRRDGTKIYHLPFDQQYDRTIVEAERLECYVQTVREAERLGFRRAFRWRGSEAA